MRCGVSKSAVSSVAMQRDGYARPRRAPKAISRRDLLRLGRGPLFRADIDYDGASERVHAAWDRDDRELLLRALQPVAEALVAVAGVAPGQHVLDAACGDGNVALARVPGAARRWTPAISYPRWSRAQRGALLAGARRARRRAGAALRGRRVRHGVLELRLRARAAPAARRP